LGNQLDFSLGRLTTIRQKHQQPFFFGCESDLLGDRCKERIGNIRHDDADQTAPPRLQRTSHLIGFELKTVRVFLDFPNRFFADPKLLPQPIQRP